MEEKSAIQPVPLRVVRDENYRTVYVNGAFGMVNPLDGCLILHVTSPVPVATGSDIGTGLKVGEFEQRLLLELRMSPATWKSIADLMQLQATALMEQAVEAIKNGSKIQEGPNSMHR